MEFEEISCSNFSTGNHLISNFYSSIYFLFQERETYTQKIIKERYPNDASKTSLNAEEMSEFYKDFLDRNWSAHFHYNIEWQKRNFTIVFLSVLVGIQNVTKKFL